MEALIVANGNVSNYDKLKRNVKNSYIIAVDWCTSFEKYYIVPHLR